MCEGILLPSRIAYLYKIIWKCLSDYFVNRLFRTLFTTLVRIVSDKILVQLIKLLPSLLINCKGSIIFALIFHSLIFFKGGINSKVSPFLFNLNHKNGKDSLNRLE